MILENAWCKSVCRDRSFDFGFLILENAWRNPRVGTGRDLSLRSLVAILVIVENDLKRNTEINARNWVGRNPCYSGI